MRINSLAKQLKEENPLKFLELLPDMLQISFFEKTNLLGYSTPEISNIIEKGKNTIDNRINSKYNMSKILLGVAIFLGGKFIATKIFQTKNEGG